MAVSIRPFIEIAGLDNVYSNWSEARYPVCGNLLLSLPLWGFHPASELPAASRWMLQTTHVPDPPAGTGSHRTAQMQKEFPMKQSGAENILELATTLKRWQQVESLTIAHTTAILERTKNPLIHLVMEIIRQDSTMHLHVQQVMLDSLEKEDFRLIPEELTVIWEMIEQHAEMEKESVALGERALRSTPLYFQRQLLAYLMEDEKKHVRLLEQLEDFKRKISSQT
jgi:hypothetical protein